MAWTTVNELKQQVKRLWDRGALLATLIDDNDEPFFPRRLVFKTPSAKELSERYDEARQWMASVQKADHLQITMKPVRHRLLGDNVVPAKAWLKSFDDAIQILGKKREAQQFSELISLTRSRHPTLLPWVKLHAIKALSLTDVWARLLDVIDWLKANPKPAIYLRQVDIPGIDTKFIESSRAVLIVLLDLCLPADIINRQFTGAGRFELRYGFLSKPERVRFRVLDPDIRLIGGSIQDIELTSDAFRCLDSDERFKGVGRVFITENEINFLTFPAVEQSLVLFGAGYGFEALADIPWLARLQIYYWGDIDTHGFAILDQLRAKLPHTQSLLMDEATLLAHRPFWGQEGRPENRQLKRLTAAELALYNDLIDNRFQNRLRLEQELVGFNYLCTKIGS